MTERARSLAWLLAGAVLGTFLAVYFRALSYPPVFDDYPQLIENRAIRYLFHPRIFLEAVATRSRPLPFLTFALVYQWAGFSLSAQRVTSLLVHLANAGLVAWLFRRWFARGPGPAWGALVAGAVFLLHPLAVDSVVYFSARGAVLVLFFLLLALAYHARERQGLASLVGFLFFGLLAFLSRESAAALGPLVLLAHWLLRRRHGELVPYLAPLVAAGGVALAFKAGYIDAAMHGFFRIQDDVDVRSWGQYLRLSLSLWPRLLELFVRPGALSIDHQLALPTAWTDPAVLGGIAAWALLGLAAVAFALTRNGALFALCWLGVSLFPTNGVFPLLDPLAERHLYIALPALAWLCGFAAEKGGARLAVPAAIAALVAGVGITLPRVLDWSSEVAIWSAAGREAPTKFRIAFNLASALIKERGDTEGAARALAQTFTGMAPGGLSFEEQSEAIDSLGQWLRMVAVERGVEARGLWREWAGDIGEFWFELVLLRAERDAIPFAAWEKKWEDGLRRARSVSVSPRANDPKWVENTFTLMKVDALMLHARHAEAFALLETVIRSFPQRHFPYWTMRETLGDLYREAGREDEALAQYEAAAFQFKVFKRFPVPLHRKIYEILRARGDWLRASDAIGELVRVQTDNPELRALYAELLQRQNHRHASRQAKEAAFYAQHAVTEQDERERVGP